MKKLVTDMGDTQKKLLDMLEWFHNFCVEHHIKYFIIGGTLLGAVRHKGFIPWDDDIDIGMPRNEYLRLIECMGDGVYENKYLLEAPLLNKDFVYQYCKLYDITTTLIENTRYKTKRGLFLDIFPIDGIGNTLEESIKNFSKIDRKNKFISTKVCAISKHRKFYKNAAIVVSRCIPEFICSWRKTAGKLDKLCASRDYDAYEYVGNLFGNWHEKEIVKREWLNEPKLYTFEHLQVYGPQDADSYLTAIYGNYMQPPPPEKQKSHHDYIFLDLNKSYLE